jgi:hypothetical protein
MTYHVIVLPSHRGITASTSMPPKKKASQQLTLPAAASSDSATANSPSSNTTTVRRNYAHEELAVLAWLSNPDHRNIVTGAAGSAQNGGGLSGSKCVTSKDAGWGMLAAHLNATFRNIGVTFDKKQAQNKFNYLEKKYHAAKIWQNTSGVGVSEADRQRGSCLQCLYLSCINIFHRY